MFSCSAAATAVDRSTCVQCYHSPADGILLLPCVMFDVYSCNALSAQFFDVDRALNSCFVIMIMIIRVAVSVQYCARNPFLSVCI